MKNPSFDRFVFRHSVLSFNVNNYIFLHECIYLPGIALHLSTCRENKCWKNHCTVLRFIVTVDFIDYFYIYNSNMIDTNHSGASNELNHIATDNMASNSFNNIAHIAPLGVVQSTFLLR